MAGIKIVAGLGNPGERYADTRHNAGVWFVDAIADSFGANFSAKKNIGATIAKTGGIANATTLPAVILLKPESYMNESGTAVAAAARYFEAAANEVLIAHDEVDLPPGAAKLKFGGGEAGHKGLLDVSRAFGSRDYWRLRFGVGRGEFDTADYVLRRPPSAERELITAAINRAAQVWQEITGGDMPQAMLKLHTES